MSSDITPPAPVPSSEPSRRKFLRTSGVGAGVLAVGTPLLRAQQQPALRVGLIGCGGRGSGAATQALAADDNVKLVAMGDAFESAIESSRNGIAEQAGEGPDGKSKVDVPPERRHVGTDAFMKVLEEEIDVVILATPPGFRPQHLRAAVEAGKHIFCEKPMAVDATGVRSVIESAQMARAKNLSLVAGYCWRYSDSRRSAFQQIEDGAIGTINSIFATYYTGPVKPHPDPSTRPDGMGDVEWQIRNWYNYSWLSGDGLCEQAIHSVDKIGWAMGDIDPIACVATGGRQVPSPGGNIYDHFHVAYEFPNQVWAHLGCRQIKDCHRENADYIRGDQGALVIGRGGTPILQDNDGKRTWRYQGQDRNMYQNEHDELFQGIRKGEALNDGEWMAHSTMLGIMGRMAAYTGKRVTWEDAMNSEEDLAPDTLAFDDDFDPGSWPIPGKG